jgi:hypothetical protein
MYNTVRTTDKQCTKIKTKAKTKKQIIKKGTSPQGLCIEVGRAKPITEQGQYKVSCVDSAHYRRPCARALRGSRISILDDSREWFPDILPRHDLQAMLQPPESG